MKVWCPRISFTRATQEEWHSTLVDKKKSSYDAYEAILRNCRAADAVIEGMQIDEMIQKASRLSSALVKTTHSAPQ